MSRCICITAPTCSRKLGLSPPRTCQELCDAAIKLTRDTDGNGASDTYGFGFRGGKSGHEHWGSFTLGAPGVALDEGLTSDAGVAGTQFVIDLFQKDKAFPPSAPNDGFQEIIGAFKTGVTAMTIHHVGSSNDLVEALGDKVAAVPVPECGGRNWRIKTIFETNIRTSYMAGRLKQMRDPDMVKLRPFWMYRHADTRVPKSPRPQHVAFDGLVLLWNDPWWNVYFPPNDWVCSCGVHSLSRGDLRRMDKTGPDPAPEIVRAPYTHDATGVTVQLPEGTGYGWDHMPGDLWERGLVPSALRDDPLARERGDPKGQNLIAIDQSDPIEDLLARARPFKAQVMDRDLPVEDYVSAFMQQFDTTIGQARLWQDVTGTRIVISDQIFRDASGNWKAAKRGHGDHALLLAEAIKDPDEVWLGLRSTPDLVVAGREEVHLTRR